MCVYMHELKCLFYKYIQLTHTTHKHHRLHTYTMLPFIIFFIHKFSLTYSARALFFLQN